jgi:hypothetical protein
MSVKEKLGNLVLGYRVIGIPIENKSGNKTRDDLIFLSHAKAYVRLTEIQKEDLDYNKRFGISILNNTYSIETVTIFD